MKHLIIIVALHTSMAVLSQKSDNDNLQMHVLTDSNGIALNVYNITKIFPAFDNEITDYKSKPFAYDSLIQKSFERYIPVHKVESIHTNLYSSVFASVYKSRQEYELAAFFYSKAYSTDPNKSASLSFELGTCYYLIQRLDSAEKYLLKTIEIEPNNLSALTNLGWIYAELFNYEKSLSYFEKAFELASNDTEIINNYGYALYLSNQLDKAENFVLRAQELNPENPFVYRNLGLIYMKRGKKRQACAFLNQSIEYGMIVKWGSSYIAELQEYCNK